MNELIPQVDNFCFPILITYEIKTTVKIVMLIIVFGGSVPETKIPIFVTLVT